MEKATKELRISELRALEDAERMIVEGYASVFDSPTDLGYWTEVIEKTAFDECDMTDVCMKYNHEDNVLIMARTRNGSLQLSTDSIGLKVRAELINTTQNVDIYKMIKAGLLDKMSFAFSVKEAKWQFGQDGESDVRRITKIDKLFDVSVVDFPAYDSTSIYARSQIQCDKEREELKKTQQIEVDKMKLKLMLSL